MLSHELSKSETELSAKSWDVVKNAEREPLWGHELFINYRSTFTLVAPFALLFCSDARDFFDSNLFSLDNVLTACYFTLFLDFFPSSYQWLPLIASLQKALEIFHMDVRSYLKFWRASWNFRWFEVFVICLHIADTTKGWVQLSGTEKKISKAPRSMSSALPQTTKGWGQGSREERAFLQWRKLVVKLKSKEITHVHLS